MPNWLVTYLTSTPTWLILTVVMTGLFFYLHLKLKAPEWRRILRRISDDCAIGVDVKRIKPDPTDSIVVTPGYTKHNQPGHSHDINKAVWDAIESCFAWKAAFWVSERDDALFAATIFGSIFLFMTKPEFAATLPPVFLVTVGFAKTKARKIGAWVADVADSCQKDHEKFLGRHRLTFEFFN